MEYKTIKTNSYNIHFIKTSKFKTTRMEIVFSRSVEKDKMPIFTFLADILSDSAKKYQRRKDIAIRLEELYKASFYSTTNKVGNLFTTSFILEFIDDHYINDNNYLENVIKLPFEFINNPLVDNNEFDITNFNIVKRRMKEEIESIKESSDKLALISALKEMDSSSPSSYRVLGELEDLERITPSNLYDAYLDLLNHSNCDIFIIGNVCEDKIVNIIKDNFKNRVIKINKINIDVVNKKRSKVKIASKESSFVQSTLVMIYNINNLCKKDKNISFHLFNSLLGSGGLNSKLYKNLRNDNSLCYSVRSLYLKYDGLLVVLVSLDNSNIKLAEKLIKKSIKEMISGDYSDDEIEDAKKNLLFSLKMSLDNNVSILNNYVFNYFDDLPLIEDRMNMLKDISKSDLINCGKSLSLNTIYVQSGGNNNEGN